MDAGAGRRVPAAARSDRLTADAADAEDCGIAEESAGAASSAWAMGAAAITAQAPRATDSAPTNPAARSPLRLLHDNGSPIG
ncbi:MAG: hypothetical protein ACKOB8_09380 [Mycobacterium sp.]